MTVPGARDVIASVRRMRNRLERARVGAGAARGAIVGVALALGWMALAKWVRPGWPEVFAWFLPLLGAVAGAAWTLRRTPISIDDAAVFLDRELDTQWRFATVATREGAAIDRVCAELPWPVSLPAAPVPRGLTLVPAAVFLLVAMHWLPAGESPVAPQLDLVVATNGGTGPGVAPGDPASVAVPVPEADDLADAAQAAQSERAIETLVGRPEERAEARTQLAKAQAGDARAATELAETLKRRLEGARARTGVISARMYPDEVEFLAAYRAALAEMR